MTPRARIATVILVGLVAFVAGWWVYLAWGPKAGPLFRVVEPIAVSLLCLVLLYQAYRSYHRRT